MQLKECLVRVQVPYQTPEGKLESVTLTFDARSYEGLNIRLIRKLITRFYKQSLGIQVESWLVKHITTQKMISVSPVWVNRDTFNEEAFEQYLQELHNEC